jgi:tripartite-type tricarboxylate transporter receptor subunit TctC
MKKLLKNVLACAGIIGIACLGLGQAQAADPVRFPVRPVRLVVPFAAGGASDIIARLVAQKLAEIWSSPVIVENRPGASGALGNTFVAKSAPDGYTLLMGGPSSLSGPAAINPNLPYDPLKDFSHVAIVCSFPSILVVNPTIARTLPELITLLKANPGKYTYASSGNGTSSHLIAELFKSMTGTNIHHVPYKGSSPGLNDVMAGHVSMSFDPINVVTPLVQSQRLRALGVSSLKRASEFPDVPTIAEVAPGFEADSWIGFLAPAGTPPDVVLKISNDVKTAVHAPDVAKRLKELTLTPVGSTPEEFSKMLASDIAKWRRIAQIANIKAE